MASIGVGLIGTGYMGKCHALAWNAVNAVFEDVPRPRLAVLCDVPEGKAQEKAAAFGFERATADWRALVDDPAVDIVSITTPNAFHREMAVYALDRGKHVWCEKPMATVLGDAEAMLEAQRRSGRLAALGYNYIQNPAIRHIGRLLEDGVIGAVNHARFEMDEDFMADPEAPFYWKSESSSGHGALDDFGVHVFSIVTTLLGSVIEVFGASSKPYADRPHADGGRRRVETSDIAAAFLRLESGVMATVALNRSAWGRKGRLAFQLFGSRGTITFDQERMNEIRLYVAEGPEANQGFRTILSAPAHPPYGRFVPAPGHNLGFNDLKIIECREILGRLRGEPARLVTFEEGIAIERIVAAVATASRQGKWISVEG
jgi:predicted dehydrogenase